jgi:cell division protein FtsB
MKNQILLIVLITSLFWFLGCYMYIDLTHKDCIDCSVLVDENNKKYQNELDSLNLLRDSLEKEIIVAEFKSDSLRNSISARNKELNKLRKQYNETIATIDSMSNDKLVEFLTNRYK